MPASYGSSGGLLAYVLPLSVMLVAALLV